MRSRALESIHAASARGFCGFTTVVNELLLSGETVEEEMNGHSVVNASSQTATVLILWTGYR